MATQDNPAEELGRSYATLLEGQAWDVDLPQAVETGPGAKSASDAAIPSPIRILEALLFVGGAPLTPVRAAEIIRGFGEEQLTQAIDELNQTYRRQDRPYHIQSQGNGYVLALKPRFRPVVEKLQSGPREARLSTAAIDVLALVAYRQPATRAEIEAVRGADSGAILRQLLRRGLIQVVYRADAEQREVSYGTTPRFLEVFGLSNLDDLPRTQDLQQM